MINIIQNTIGALGRRATSSPSFVGLLNTYSGSSIAYSLRLLDSTYTGSAIRVRRSSDNAEQDIGFASNILDTASLLTFVGSGDGFVDTWYDQSGNAKDMTQATASKQGQIVASGVVLVDGGLPVIRAVNGSTGMVSSYDASSAPTSKQFFSVIKASASVTSWSGTILFGSWSNASDYLYVANDADTSTGVNGNNIALSSELVNNQSFTYSTRGEVYATLSSQSILSASSVFSYSPLFCLGYKVNSNTAWSMYDMQEVIIFENQTDQSAKVTAINNHYSVY